MSVARLLVSPLSEGLVHRAILQSGAARGRNRHLREDRPNQPSMGSVGEDLFAALGVADEADPLAAAREVDPRTLIEAADPQLGLTGSGVKYAPVVDGWALPEAADEMLAEGRFHDVPVIAGANADDGSIFATAGRRLGPRGYQMLLRRIAGEQADALLEQFPAPTREDVPQAMSDLMTVSAFVAPARSLVRSVNLHGGDGWLYHFTRVPEAGRARQFGAFHGLEIAYIFGGTGLARQLGPTDAALSEAMRQAWVRFARDGDPNGPGLPRWQQWTDGGEECLYFGAQIESGRAPWVEACEIFDRIDR
jgi:para-nitrobenzyl esterase